MKFEVGDRVECVVKYPDGNKRIDIGSTGTVCKTSEYSQSYGVNWDNYVSGSDCGGTCAPGYGWFVRGREIKLHEEENIDIDETIFMNMIGGAG